MTPVKNWIRSEEGNALVPPEIGGGQFLMDNPPQLG